MASMLQMGAAATEVTYAKGGVLWHIRYFR